ncbi:MAG TPA: phosphate ABC transporter substrate-binding protein [Pseudomonadales bacterium]|nr:phosphate ABC transporter substrate-binding protein [Pseudomonadales bacterium]
MRNFSLKCMLAVCLGLFSVLSHAEGIAVIVNPAAGVDTLTKEDVARIFMAKTKQFPNEKDAKPIEHKPDATIRAQFEDKVLEKSAGQLKAYWSQLVFTGRAVPPDEYGSDAEIKKAVAGNPAFVGYIDPANVDTSVKVVYFAQ